MTIHEFGYYWSAAQYDYLGGISAASIGSAACYVEYSMIGVAGETVCYFVHQENGWYGRVNLGDNASITFSGLNGVQTIPLGKGVFVGQPFTVGVDYDPDRTGQEIDVYFWNNDGVGFGLAGSVSAPAFFDDFNTISRFSGSFALVSRIIVRAGGINGTETHHYNANYVQTSPGEFRVRQSADVGGIWNINPTTERESSTKDQPFELYNGIAEVNGESAKQTITLGDTGQTVSLPPTLTTGTLLVYGVDTPYTYDSATGLATFDAPAMGDLVGCDPIGESEISIAGSEPIAITTTVPAPYDVVTLVGPIYTGETSYTFGSDFTPSVGWQHVFNADEVDVYPDNQFDIVSSDGVIDFTGYSVDPSTGMQQYPVSNQAVTDSTLNATITNIPDGTYDTRVLSTAGDVLFFGPKAWASESASFTLTDVPAGTSVEYYVIGSTEGGIDRGVTE